MSHYRLRPVLFVGLILILFVFIGWIYLSRTSDSNIQDVASKPTFESSPTPTSKPIDLMANFNQWREDYPAPPLRLSLVENYPLFIPDEAALNIPEYYAGYDRQIVGMAIPKNGLLIGINYRFKENVGGGTSAYAAQYGWDIDQQAGILYVTGDTWDCVDKNFRDIIANEFNLENGLYIATRDDAVIEIDVDTLKICEDTSQ